MEERDRLLSRLLLCVTFKDVAAVFLRRIQESERFVARSGGMDQRVADPAPRSCLPVDRSRLAACSPSGCSSRRTGRPDLDHLDLDLPSVEDAMADIQSRMAEMVAASFDDLIETARRRSEVAAYFLALLELARWGLLSVSQADGMAPIQIRYHPTIDLRSAG